MSEGNTDSTQRLGAVYTKLRQITEKARQEPELRFTALAHLMTADLLRESFQRLRKQAAPGVDGVTWLEYSANSDERLEDLHRRLREGRYRAQPVRRVFIEKEDGSSRPLGIPSTEDKIVQRATVTILEAIYEQDFFPFSYGFRPEKGAWDALDALSAAVYQGSVNYVVDADIKAYFDSVVQSHLMEFVRRRVGDRNILRLIAKWLRAGVIDEGRLLISKVGTPQGSVVSPLLANMYLHYVLDEWWVRDVLPRMRGQAHIVRYADDFVLAFQNLDDAQRVMSVLGKRFERYGLELHPTKTRLLPFGRYAREIERRRGGDRPQTFNFLGFTHISTIGRSAPFAYHVRTMSKRLSRALKSVAEWCRCNRHLPIPDQQNRLRAILQGHYNYYGRRTNSRSLATFRQHVERIWFKWLQRRSQKRTLVWEQFREILARYPLPPPRIRQPAWQPT